MSVSIRYDFNILTDLLNAQITTKCENVISKEAPREGTDNSERLFN